MPSSYAIRHGHLCFAAAFNSLPVVAVQMPFSQLQTSTLLMSKTFLNFSPPQTALETERVKMQSQSTSTNGRHDIDDSCQFEGKEQMHRTRNLVQHVAVYKFYRISQIALRHLTGKKIHPFPFQTSFSSLSFFFARIQIKFLCILYSVFFFSFKMASFFCRCTCYYFSGAECLLGHGKIVTKKRQHRW